MKKIIIFVMCLLILTTGALAAEDIYDDIENPKLRESAGLTPDSNFYFLETLVETVLVGDNPETALRYKEEKIAELKEMVDQGKTKEAKEALGRAKKYGEIVKREVSPKIEKRTRESSKAIKELLEDIETDDRFFQEDIDEHLIAEDKIALTAKISGQIKVLCERLSELDPLEYGRVCKTDDDSPKWQKELDEDLTEEQKEEAEKFFKTLSGCFENPSECRCDDITVPSFAEKCKVMTPLAAECEAGDESACDKMDKIEDPIKLLPAHLQDAMRAVEDRFRDSEFDRHVPKECREAGADDKDSCAKITFKLHAPPECQEALDKGEIDPGNERESRQQCDKIMFKSNAPKECVEADIEDFRECDKHMFKLDAPRECIEAGLTGDGRDDWQKCEVIRFKLDAPQECLEAGITGEGKEDRKKCDAIRFRLDAPQSCLDAGLTGEGRDDWKECQTINFKVEAPDYCIDAGLTGEGRNDWKECEGLKFQNEADPACLEAGLTGANQRDWKECQKITFKLDAPQECLDAGITGERSGDWRKCDEIRKDFEGEGDRKEDCGPNELHICEGGNCFCTSDKDSGCGAIDCEQGFHCEYGKCFPDGGECGDCASKCPGSSGTDCVNGQCECYYDGKGSKSGQEASECNDGCNQECGDQNTDCVDGNCVCLGYGSNGPPSNGGGDGCVEQCTLYCECGTVAGSCGCECLPCEKDDNKEPEENPPVEEPKGDDGTPENGEEKPEETPVDNTPEEPKDNTDGDEPSEDTGSGSNEDTGGEENKPVE